VKSLFIRFSCVLAGCLPLVWLNCANPVDEPPLKWRSNIEVPMTNEKFVLADEFTGLFSGVTDDSLDTTGKMLILKRDTVCFSAPSKDTVEFETGEDSLEDKIYHENVGLIPLTNAPAITASVPLPKSGAKTLPSAALPIAMNKVYALATVANSGPIEITVTNNSTNATISTLTLAFDHGIGSRSISSPLGPGQSAVLSYTGASLLLDSTVVMTPSGSLDVLDAGSGTLGISISLKKLIVASATVQDSLIPMDLHFQNAYKMSDSVDIDYIDVEYGFFNYEFFNGTGIPILVSAKHRHLWTTPYSQSKGFTKYTDIINADSTFYYSGNITGRTQLLAPANFKTAFTQLNISGNRLFCEWETAGSRSVTVVDYFLKTEPTGKKITLNATDSLVFIIKPTTIKFKEMVGKLVKPFKKQSDTQYVEIRFPWGESSKDSLRGKFYLESALADVRVANDLPERAYLDTVNMIFTIYDPKKPSAKIDTSISYYHICKDSLFKRTIDITPVVNSFPDSVAVDVDITVPVGTRMRVLNNNTDTTGYMMNKIGQMTLRTFPDYRMTAKFSWRVDSAARIDLGNGQIAIAEWARLANKMTEREASFNMNVYNNSNVYIRLYGLLLPGVTLDSLNKLDTLGIFTTGIVTQMINDPNATVTKPYINLLGPEGILIPPRDSSAFNSVDLNEAELKALFADTVCGMRWQLRFMPMKNDALIDTDYIEIHSWIHLRGTNNMDSLLIW